MKLAIMQPYLFPYIGYYSLIQNTDYFVFFDTPQYIRKGWINRNRIVSSKGTDIYFTVPIEKTFRDAAINTVKISVKENWKEKILGQLTVYKKKAPYFLAVRDIVCETFAYETAYISELAVKSILTACEYLGIDIKYEIYSQMDIPSFEVKEKDEWALYITKAMGYDTYVNPPGGKNFFNPEKYRREGIQLEFLTQELRKYNQHSKVFLPGLSILDVMMFCSPKEILQMMDFYILEKGEKSE